MDLLGNMATWPQLLADLGTAIWLSSGGLYAADCYVFGRGNLDPSRSEMGAPNARFFLSSTGPPARLVLPPGSPSRTGTQTVADMDLLKNMVTCPQFFADLGVCNLAQLVRPARG